MKKSQNAGKTNSDGDTETVSQLKQWLADNIWWILPSIILIVFFGWGVWFQSQNTLNTEIRSYNVPGENYILNAAQPTRILYGQTEPVSLNLSLSCTSSCNDDPIDVIVQTRASLLVMDEGANPPIWSNRVLLQLTPDRGFAKLSLLRQKGVDIPSNLDLTVAGEYTASPEVYMEGENQALLRLMATELWTRASVAITILTALIGWSLKQREESRKAADEKRKEALKGAEKSADKLRERLKGDISLAEWLEEYQNEIKKRTNETERQEIKKTLRELVNNDKLQVMLSMDFNRSYKAGEQAFENLWQALEFNKKSTSGISFEATNLLLIIEKIIRKKNLVAAYKLLVKHRGRVRGIVFRMFQQYPDEARNFFDNKYLTFIKSAGRKSSFSLRYLRANFGNFTDSWYRVPYSLENYPLETLLLHNSWNLAESKEDPELVEWIKLHWDNNLDDSAQRWQRAHSPFFDLQNPLQILEKADEAQDINASSFIESQKYLNLNNNLGFDETSLEPVRHAPQHTIFRCETRWEVLASLASYCQTQPKNLKSFVVYIHPLRFGKEETDPAKIVLHAIANQWIETLALNYYSYLELENTQRERLSRLLHWHAGDSLSLRALLVDAFQEKSREDFPTSSKPEKDDASYIFGEIASCLSETIAASQSTLNLEAFVSVRPKDTAHTVLVVPSTSLTPVSNSATDTVGGLSAKQFNSLFGISDLLHEKNVYIKAFIQKDTCQDLNTDCTQIEIKLSPTELANACNMRFAYVFQEDANTIGLNFLFVPGTKPAEDLLAERACGSLGRMLQLGQQLLLNHAHYFPKKKYLSFKEFDSLQA